MTLIAENIGHERYSFPPILLGIHLEVLETGISFRFPYEYLQLE